MMGLIGALLEAPHTFAVVGASREISKYGHEVLESLAQSGHRVLPINPRYNAIDGHACHASLSDLLEVPDVVVTAAPAAVSAMIAETCAALGIRIFWMPPGTESDAALETCTHNNVTAIHGFCPVFLLKLPRERWVELP